MLTIANWAKHHIATARLLIALLHIYVFCSAVYLSQLLIQVGIYFSLGAAIPLFLLGFGVIAGIGFYRKKLPDDIVRLRLQKFRFYLMGISCTLLLVGYSNTMSVTKTLTATPVMGAFIITEKKEKPLYENYTDKQTYYKDLRTYYSTLSRKELRRQLKEMKKTSSSAGSVAIAIIIIWLLGLALYVVAGLACSLSCNGQDGLAILVLIGGLTAIVGLAVLAIKIFRKKRQKRKAIEEKSQTASSRIEPVSILPGWQTSLSPTQFLF